MLAPILLFSMVAHEYAHGYAALRQGDDTALRAGRLTWNPLKHIDPFLTVVLPVMMFLTLGVAFGGAKPVPVDPRLYRNYRRGDIIVSLAGVTVNLILAVLLTGVIILLGLLGRAVPGVASSLALLQLMFVFGVTINLLLAIFNLLPIPPLDGSHVVKHFLPPAWAIRYQRLAGAGFLVLVLLILFGRPVINAWLAPVFFLARVAQGVFAPFLLPTAWAPT
ncbi:MAG: site-2 protease family protein [Gemmatimonadaceae bacterium]